LGLARTDALRFPKKICFTFATEEGRIMKRLMGLCLGLCLLFGAVGMLMAQDKPEMSPPKVLTIFREWVKPGRTGSMHDKSESAFVQAMNKAKWPTHYLAVDSVSGKPRSLFLTGYDSFADWEKDVQASGKNAALTASVEQAARADADLLDGVDASVLVFREDQSLRAGVDIAHMRYFEISLFNIKPGHRKDWDDAVKLVKKAYEKIPDAHWAMYEVAYGQVGAEYVVFTPMKSASEIDAAFARDKDFAAAMGEEGMKKLAELEASGFESVQSNLFTFNPKMSYVDEAWVKADPDFWKPKAAMPKATKKPAEKPAGSQ